MQEAGSHVSENQSDIKSDQDNLKFFHYPHPFQLEAGDYLPEFTLAYHTYGKLNDAKDNVVWVVHAQEVVIL
jgi:homoserine acetyltransferase